MFARFVATALLLVAVSAPAFAQGNGDRGGLTGSSENLPLFREVQSQVLRYPHFTIFDSVNAQIDNGVVVLTGKVTMPYKKSDIVRRVARLDSVREVQDKIEVLPVSQFDDQLRYQIARAIYGNPMFVNYATMVNPPIHIIVDRGRVTLEGVVNSNVERMLARSIATSFLAFDVTNALQTDQEAKQQLEKL
jgi:hyperosmotically inducible protein